MRAGVMVNATNSSVPVDPIFIWYANIGILFLCVVFFCFCCRQNILSTVITVVQMATNIVFLIYYLFTARPENIPIVADITTLPACTFLDILIQNSY